MPSPLPNPLALHARAFARASLDLRLAGGERGALERYARLHRTGVAEPALMDFAAPVIDHVHTSDGHEGTLVKFLLRIPRATQAAEPRSTPLPVIAGPDGAPVDHLHTESVLIPMIGRKRVRTYTLCVSSQVGCAMGCGFCQTAQMGLIRSLTAAEIVAQFFAARHLIQRPDPDATISNIVFMGMGEPMDNLDAVLDAIEVLTDSRGPAIPMSRVTISTVGRVDGIRRMAERVTRPGWHRLALAVSLNAPSDSVRSGIMPVNRAVPMATLREALCDWPHFGSAHLCLEYVLIPGVNDADEHAAQLAAYVHGEEFEPRARDFGDPATAPPAWDAAPRWPGPALRGLVNVIPYNPRDNSPWNAPTEEQVDRFMTVLKSLGVYCKRRRTKGRDKMAACGQLGNPELRRRRPAPTR